MNLVRSIFCLLKVLLHTTRSSFVQMHTSHLRKGSCKVIDKRLKGSKQSFATLKDFQTGNNQSLNQHIGEVILTTTFKWRIQSPTEATQLRISSWTNTNTNTKNTTRDGGGTALYNLHCLYCSNCFTLLKQKRVCLYILLGKVRTLLEWADWLLRKMLDGWLDWSGGDTPFDCYDY